MVRLLGSWLDSELNDLWLYITWSREEGFLTQFWTGHALGADRVVEVKSKDVGKHWEWKGGPDCNSSYYSIVEGTEQS
jgi:hypothetical protein